MSEYSSSPSRPASPVGPPHPTTQPFRFRWDAGTRGPGSVSETTEGRGGGDYFATTSRLHIPSASTTHLPLGAFPTSWSSATQGFNAISNVLNNPHRSQAPPKAHSFLPPVPPAILPRLKRKDFDSYLRVITPEWERFVQNAQLARQGSLQLGGPLTSPPSGIPLSPRTPRPNKALTPLNTVPSVFFDPKFDLANSRVFDAVTERQEGTTEASDPASLSYSLPLLEKLSHHADTVEQHLVREISLRSTSFFAALTNLQDLQTESEGCLDQISKLRGLLKEVDDKGPKCGLEILRKESKLLNLRTVYDGTKEISGVMEMIGVAKGLVGAGQWSEALEIINSIEMLWDPSFTNAPSESITRKGPSYKINGRRSPLPPTPELPTDEEDCSNSKRSIVSSMPLSSLNAFASLPSHLRSLTMEIASSLTKDLVNVLRSDLLERISGDRKDAGSSGSVNLTLKDRLRPLLHGLMRTKSMREATSSWRDAVAKEMIGIAKQHLPSFDPDEEDKNAMIATVATSGLSGHLRSKTHIEFLSLISQLYGDYMNGIEGLQMQSGILMEVLENQQSPVSPTDITSIQEELVDVLSMAADLSNKFAAKVIGYRSEQHAQLELPDFLSIFNESWNFTIKSEIICRHMIMRLRGTVLNQAKLFLQVFHQSRINQAAKLVEDEQWNQIDIPPCLQHLVDILVDSAVQDSPELTLQDGMSSSTPPVNGQALESPPSSPHRRKFDSNTPSSKCIRIEDRPYFCVAATGAVLDLLLDYLRLLMNLSILNTETMGRVIEFLKTFNSRTCQVVLGAGAMRSAGLKNITAKHLALASQSLSIMVALIPYVREMFRRHLSPNQAVMLIEFDKLKRDFQEHQNEIHSKLISIMGDRINAHVKSLQLVDWDAPKQNDSANDYMEVLIKETVTLHKVLSRYLSAPTVEFVMSQVFAAINHRLSEEYTKIDLQSQEAKDRLLADARFLHQKLSVLKNVTAPTNMLETLVGEKTLPRKSGLGAFRTLPSPNGRIRGFLSRRESTRADKPLPVPEEGAPETPSAGLSGPQTLTVGDATCGEDPVIITPLPSDVSCAAEPQEGEGTGTDGDKPAGREDVSDAGS